MFTKISWIIIASETAPSGAHVAPEADAARPPLILVYNRNLALVLTHKNALTFQQTWINMLIPQKAIK